MARASPERRDGELGRLKDEMDQRGAEGDQAKISRRGGAQAPGSRDRSLKIN